MRREAHGSHCKCMTMRPCQDLIVHEVSSGHSACEAHAQYHALASKEGAQNRSPCTTRPVSAGHGIAQSVGRIAKQTCHDNCGPW
eukprot:1257934-Rhodomonas_salina.9